MTLAVFVILRDEISSFRRWGQNGYGYHVSRLRRCNTNITNCLPEEKHGWFESWWRNVILSSGGDVCTYVGIVWIWPGSMNCICQSEAEHWQQKNDPSSREIVSWSRSVGTQFSTSLGYEIYNPVSIVEKILTLTLKWIIIDKVLCNKKLIKFQSARWLSY